jgi:lycopene cyclase domain-containing protein
MTYTLAAGVGVVAALAVDLVGLRTRVVLGRVFWLSYAITLFFQLLANGVLAGRGVVRYDPAAILGPRVAGAPVEDLAFGFALVVATVAVWTRLGSSRPGAPRLGSSRPEAPRQGSPRLQGTVGGGPGEAGEHLRGVARERDVVQGPQGRLGEVGDASLGPGERPGGNDDVA